LRGETGGTGILPVTVKIWVNFGKSFWCRARRIWQDTDCL